MARDPKRLKLNLSVPVPRTITNNKQEYIGTETLGPGTWKILARKITD
jgi:hypothetical protein